MGFRQVSDHCTGSLLKGKALVTTVCIVSKVMETVTYNLNSINFYSYYGIKGIIICSLRSE